MKPTCECQRQEQNEVAIGIQVNEGQQEETQRFKS